MNILNDFLGNTLLTSAVTGWFIAQLIKVIYVFIECKKFDIKRFVGSGGMPSSHTAFVVALSTSCGFVRGFDSPEFAICFCLSMIVMYDAAGVRRAAGEQAAVINKIVQQTEEETKSEILDGNLKELIGHSPIEVVAGAVLGIFVGILFRILL